MKLFLVALSLLASSLALATPTIGDSITLDITWMQGGKTATGTAVLALTAYDAAAKSYTLHQTLTYEGRTQNSDIATPAANLLTDDQIHGIVTNCVKYGGASETIVTGKGALLSCGLPVKAQDGSYTGTTWVAPVPLGIVKTLTNYTNGDSTTGLLKDFTAGK
jgi:hypothetical protein